MFRAVEKRNLQRSKRRLTCELVIGEKSYTAIVRDISPSGLFLQTLARPAPGSVVWVVFPAENGRAEIRLEAGVARRRVVPPRLQAAVHGGVGLEVLGPPPEFQKLVSRGVGGGGEDEEEDARQDDASKSQSIRTFRVRVKQRDKPNARVLTVRSESAAGARARALAQAGRGWLVADIQEV